MQGPNPSKISRPGSLSSPFPFGHLPFHLIFYFTLPYFNLLQHYLVNSSINEQLASVARVEDGDCVLEIGPGTGALTQVLDAGATVLAVEKVLEEDFTKCHIRSHLSPCWKLENLLEMMQNMQK